MVDLASRTVWVLDAQSTGASPRHGQLLEVGWARVEPQVSEILEVTTRLIALPEGVEVPRPVARLTGLSTAEVNEAGCSDAAVWRELCEAVGEEPQPAVIHFARFELAFFRSLHGAHGGSPFPFEPVFCAHQIARRLLPELPRCSLRALTGYFGAGVGELRRSTEHVLATAVVWRHLVSLVGGLGLHTVEGLRAWLDEPKSPPAKSRIARKIPAKPLGSPGARRHADNPYSPAENAWRGPPDIRDCGAATSSSLAAGRPPPRRRRKYPMDRERRLGLPTGPGVYRMLRAGGAILYVGKARSLKRRVNGYFQKQRNISERQLEMLSQARDLEVTPTATILEAALLETEEIKRLRPPYNVSLTERESRQMVFTDPELLFSASEPSETCTVGPLGAVLGLGAIARLARADGSGNLACADLPSGLDQEEGFRLFSDGPDERTISAGIAHFLEALPTGPTFTRRLLRHGRRRPPAVLRAEDEARPARPDDAWDPARVVNVLDRLALSASVAVRRARWLCALSEATLVWRERQGPTRLLIIERGRFERFETVPDDRAAPTPAGARRPFSARQAAFDLATFDRLRVLTTELRSLLPELERVELRFGATKVLDAARLARSLPWV